VAADKPVRRQGGAPRPGDLHAGAIAISSAWRLTPATGQMFHVRARPRTAVTRFNILKARRRLRLGPITANGRNNDSSPMGKSDHGRASSLPCSSGCPESRRQDCLFLHRRQVFPAWKNNPDGRQHGAWAASTVPAGIERVVFKTTRCGRTRPRKRFLQELKQRVRDIRQGPDGLIYLLTERSRTALYLKNRAGQLERSPCRPATDRPFSGEHRSSSPALGVFDPAGFSFLLGISPERPSSSSFGAAENRASSFFCPSEGPLMQQVVGRRSNVRFKEAPSAGLGNSQVGFEGGRKSGIGRSVADAPYPWRLTPSTFKRVIPGGRPAGTHAGRGWAGIECRKCCFTPRVVRWPPQLEVRPPRWRHNRVLTPRGRKDAP